MMKALGTDIGTIHFVGIGGIGMSGIAEVMHQLGYKVQGSDASDSYVVEKLRKSGIPVSIGHSPDNLGDAAVVVCSTAIKDSNPEVQAAAERRLPRVKRAEMLAELMRMQKTVAVAGTHGKTTTTTMIAALLDGGGMDPTVVNGGVIHAYGSNARIGGGEWMVVEADESDGSFVKLPATVAVVTNIDPEHLDHYGDFDGVRAAFDAFVSNIPFYGLAVCCIDHPEVQALVGRITDRRVATYGFNPQADVQGRNVTYEYGGARFDVALNAEGRVIEGLRLPMTGDHNVSNALAAVAVARHLGIAPSAIKAALAGFGGVNRRFTKVGTWNGVTIIDDYGHHPVEITAVLKAARQATKGRVIAVHQPHRYTRLRDLFTQFCACFNDADVVAIADVYAAGEAPIDGISRDTLVGGLIAHGHRRALALAGEEALADLARAECRPGDLLVCLGAGSISAWANALPERLNAGNHHKEPVDA
jgi:UDP-N-acetylmuramate--alanine ligase